MAISNSTGKDKEFYDRGKKMFDQIQPITRGVPQIPQERYSKRLWVGLTDDEYFALQMKIKTPMTTVQDYIDAMRMIEQALKERNQ